MDWNELADYVKTDHTNLESTQSVHTCTKAEQSSVHHFNYNMFLNCIQIQDFILRLQNHEIHVPVIFQTNGFSSPGENCKDILNTFTAHKNF